MNQNLTNIKSNFIRDVNTNLVLNTIRKEKTISRTGLAKLTSLSYPTVSKIIETLIQDGFVLKSHQGEFSGGRKPLLLEFNPDANWVIGIDLSGSVARAVLADLNGDFISEVIRGESLGADSNLVEVTVRLIEKLKEEHNSLEDKMIGIGISLRGAFDLPHNLFYYAENESEPVQLMGKLTEYYDVPIIMDHVSNVALISEKLYGDIKDNMNVIYIDVGSGVRAGIMINGNIYRGTHGNPGEIGHMTVCEDGEVCPDCGRKGCLENISSVYGILKEADRQKYPLDQDLSVYEKLVVLAEAAQNGKTEAKDCFSRAIWGLGEGITDLVNILNPQLIILGGKVISTYPRIVEEVEKIVLDNCWPYSQQKLKITSSVFTRDFLLKGGVSLVLARFFMLNGIFSSNN